MKIIKILDDRTFVDWLAKIWQYGFATGSYALFKEGNDQDFVFTTDMLKDVPEVLKVWEKASIPDQPPYTVQVLPFDEYPDSFDCVTLKVNNIEMVDVIIVSNSLEFELWQYATRCQQRLARGPAKEALHNKHFRIESFELFKRMFRHLHICDYRRLGVRVDGYGNIIKKKGK